MLAEFGHIPQFNRIERGIYEGYMFDWEYRGDLGYPYGIKIISPYPSSDKLREIWQEEGETEADRVVKALRMNDHFKFFAPDYGNVDYPQQVVENWPHLEFDDEKFVIVGHWLHKRDEPLVGGYRWHKNGYYQGKLEYLGCEYFVDEPVIESIWSFRIYQVA